jgi:DNA-directed RNA polymerase subunit RPC12/RpoP
MDIAREPAVCVDCGAKQPSASRTDNTLVGKDGWRLLRRKDENDEVGLEWRCPECWAKLKRSLGGMN